MPGYSLYLGPGHIRYRAVARRWERFESFERFAFVVAVLSEYPRLCAGASGSVGTPGEFLKSAGGWEARLVASHAFYNLPFPRPVARPHRARQSAIAGEGR